MKWPGLHARMQKPRKFLILLICRNLYNATMPRRQIESRDDDSYAELFRFLVQELEDYAIFACDLDNKIRTWNPGVQRVLGYRKNEFIGRPAAMIFTPEDRRKGAVERELRTAARKGRAADERWHMRKNGRRFWGSGVMMAQRDASGKLLGFVKIMRDHTARREAEQRMQLLNDTLEQRVETRTRALTAQQDQLRALALELSRAEQGVRQRIAAELHDEVAQLLVACSYPIRAMRQQERDPLKQKEFDSTLQCLTLVINRVRTIMSGLSPVTIDQRDLGGVIDWAIDTVRDAGLHVRVENDGRAKPIGRDLLVLLGNIVRELLTNVAKHARTKEAHVTIRRVKNTAVVTVRDDGRGFTIVRKTRAGPRGGFGLFSARDRLELMEGTMEIESKRGKGTTITLTAPLQSARSQRH